MHFHLFVNAFLKKCVIHSFKLYTMDRISLSLYKTYMTYVVFALNSNFPHQNVIYIETFLNGHLQMVEVLRGTKIFIVIFFLNWKIKKLNENKTFFTNSPPNIGYLRTVDNISVTDSVRCSKVLCSFAAHFSINKNDSYAKKRHQSVAHFAIHNK